MRLRAKLGKGGAKKGREVKYHFNFNLYTNKREQNTL